jgi:hypothetical protein
MLTKQRRPANPAPEGEHTQPAHPSTSTAPATGSGDRFSELPLLDREIFERFRAMLPASAVQEIYVTCISQTLERCVKVERALKKQDWAVVRAAAHAISGSAAMVGAVRMAALARQLGCDDCAASAINSALAQLTSCCQQFSNELGKEGFPLCPTFRL